MGDAETVTITVQVKKNLGPENCFFDTVLSQKVNIHGSENIALFILKKIWIFLTTILVR